MPRNNGGTDQVSKKPTASMSILKMVAVGSSETLIKTSNITWRINSECQHLNHHHRDNLTSQLNNSHMASQDL